MVKPRSLLKEELQANPLLQALLDQAKAGGESAISHEGQTWVLQPLIDITESLTPEERREFAEDHAAADTEDSLTAEQALAYYREKLKSGG